MNHGCILWREVFGDGMKNTLSVEGGNLLLSSCLNFIFDLSKEWSTFVASLNTKGSSCFVPLGFLVDHQTVFKYLGVVFPLISGRVGLYLSGSGWTFVLPIRFLRVILNVFVSFGIRASVTRKRLYPSILYLHFFFHFCFLLISENQTKSFISSFIPINQKIIEKKISVNEKQQKKTGGIPSCFRWSRGR